MINIIGKKKDFHIEKNMMNIENGEIIARK